MIEMRQNVSATEPVYISDGQVAWEVPRGRIAFCYREGYYIYPPWRTIVGQLPKNIKLMQTPKQEDNHAPGPT